MSNESACLENLHGNLVHCEQLLQTWLCMIIVSMEAPLSEQAGFQIWNAVRCSWHTHPVAHLVLQYQTTPYGAMSTGKVYGTRSANIGDLKQKIRECTWGFFKEFLWLPFHRDHRSVLNDMAVTYKVSYSNSND
jgi:hypothetical protein